MCKSLECNMHSTCMSEIGAPPLYLTLYFLRTKRIEYHTYSTHIHDKYTQKCDSHRCLTIMNHLRQSSCHVTRTWMLLVEMGHSAGACAGTSARGGAA
jgi:hypothetical protein